MDKRRAQKSNSAAKSASSNSSPRPQNVAASTSKATGKRPRKLRGPRQYKVLQYEHETMMQAVAAVKDKKMGLRQAARWFKVPRSTIMGYIRRPHLTPRDRRMGPAPFLGWHNEDEIVRVLTERMDVYGEFVTRDCIKQVACYIVKSCPNMERRSPFTSAGPNVCWVSHFLKRHLHFTTRYKEARSTTRNPCVVTDELLASMNIIDYDMAEEGFPVSSQAYSSMNYSDVVESVLDDPAESEDFSSAAMKNISDRAAQLICVQKMETSKNLLQNVGDSTITLHDNSSEETTASFVCMPSASGAPSTTEGVKMLLRKASPRFTARAEEATALAQSLHQPSCSSLAVVGPAGVGKTELVLNVLEIVKPVFQHIFWVCGESIESVVNSLELIANMLNLPKSEHLIVSISNVFSACKLYRSLIIFDGVPNEEFVQEILPIELGCVTYLATSQYIDWQCDFRLKLNTFTPEVAQGFLKSHVSIPMTDAETQQVCELLSNLPLALQTVVSYLEMQAELSEFGVLFSIQQFINEVQNGSATFLKFTRHKSEKTGYSKALADILKPVLNTMRQLEQGQIATQLLPMIAALTTPLKNISTFALVANQPDAYLIHKLFLQFKKYSLIEKTEDSFDMKLIYKTILQFNAVEDFEAVNQ